MPDALVTAHGLETHFVARGSFAERLMGRSPGTVRAVDGVTLEIAPGEVFGLVGEWGSGQTTIGRTLLKLAQPTAGSITLECVDITEQDSEKTPHLRRRRPPRDQHPTAS